jgi:hypothetical protein
LQQVLDSAIIHLNRSSAMAFGNEDMIYNGNAQQWIKAAWGLKARLYNHLSERYPDSSAIKVIECADNSFQSSDDNMTFSAWSGSEDLQHINPWYALASKAPKELSLSETLYQLMNQTNDPRDTAYFTYGFEGFGIKFTPAPSGSAEPDASGTVYSKISSSVLKANTPLPLLTYEELLFLKAEAYRRLRFYDLAFAAYQKAVLHDLKDIGIGEKETMNNSTFYSEVLAIPPEKLTLADIIHQKYIALWPFQPIEAYTDWRRTGIPQLKNSLGEFPLRFPYPQNEISTNGANVPDVQILNDPVWWDKK